MLYEINNFPEEKTIRKKILNERPTIHPSCNIKKSKLGSWTSLGANTNLNEVVLDDYSYTAGNVSIAYSSIGKFCSIANSVRINPGNHPKWRVTQHHCTYRKKQYRFDTEDDLDFFEWRRSRHCEIGHDVWIGHGAIIMPGVSLGIGSVIGSGAVVTKNIGPYEIAVGVPAKPIKSRFPKDIASKLIEIAWWNWNRNTLESRFNDFQDLELFIEKYYV